MIQFFPPTTIKVGKAAYENMEAIASIQSGLGEVEKPTITQRLLKKLFQVLFNLLNRS